MSFKRFFKIFTAFCLITALLIPSVLAAAGGTGAALYTNTLEISDGFTYTNEISYNASGKRVESFAVETTAESDVYPIVMACDTIYGGMTISQMVSYAESQGYNVLGAVNSDFFSTATKVPLGAVIEDGIYKSSPEGENILAFSENGAFILESPEINVSLLNNGGGEYIDETTGETVSNAGKSVSVTHFNKLRNDAGGLYIFTEAFSTVSTRTTTDGWAVRMKILEGTPALGGELTLGVEEVIPSGTSFPIGEGYIVLTAAASCGMGEECGKFAVGDVVTMSIMCSDEQLSEALWATGCGDVLVSDGNVTDTANWDSALFGANPRTAVGIKEDGSIIYYVVDGRYESYSNGAKMSEIAADMIEMGCKYAVNLDGGGSSAMALKLPGNNTVSIVNKPSDGIARSCASYILFVTDNISDGAANRLYLEQDGGYVLAGASLELSYLASDYGYAVADIPNDVAAASSGLGSVSNGIYTAGETAGNDKIELYSKSLGISGSGTIHILETVDTLTVTDSETGKAPVLTDLDENSSIQLSTAMTRLSRPVYFDMSCVTFSVSENVGTITEDGLFTVAGLPGEEGTLTVTAGGRTVEYPVSIKTVFLDITDHWAKSFIETLKDAGIVNGTSKTTFSPEAGIKRGDFVLMLWRALGEPDVSTSASFADVSDDMYYAKAIAWAESAGIAQGTGDGKFNPEDTLTREQAFTLVYRALFSEDTAEDYTSFLEMFTDHDSVSEYAKQPTADMVMRGIIEGSDGKLNPQSQIKRGEMAKILCVSLNMEY